MLLTGGLVVGAGQYGDRIVDVERSRRIMRAEQMLDQTLQAVSAYSFERVAELDGEAIFEAGDPAESGMRIELEVKPASADTLRIDAVLRDARTSEIVRRIVTYRGRS